MNINLFFTLSTLVKEYDHLDWTGNFIYMEGAYESFTNSYLRRESKIDSRILTIILRILLIISIYLRELLFCLSAFEAFFILENTCLPRGKNNKYKLFELI